MRKKEKQRNILIGIVLLALAILVITQINQNTLSLASSDGINIKVTHKSYPFGSYNLPLVITPQGSSIKQGDSQVFRAVNEISIDSSASGYCNTFETIITWKKGSTIKGTETFNHGSTGAFTSLEEYTVQTSSSSTIGDYSIEAQYRCNGVILSRENSNANSWFILSGSGVNKDITAFSIYGEDEPAPDPNPVPGQRICWVHNVGVCESIYQPDTKTCSNNQRYDTKEQCEEDNPPIDTICIELGGTKDCSEIEVLQDKLILYIGIGLIIVGGFLYLRKNKFKRKR